MCESASKSQANELHCLESGHSDSIADEKSVWAIVPEVTT